MPRTLMDKRVFKWNLPLGVRRKAQNPFDYIQLWANDLILVLFCSSFCLSFYDSLQQQQSHKVDESG